MHDHELAPLLRGIEWIALDPRSIRSRFERFGWTLHAQGNRAHVYRSPTGVAYDLLLEELIKDPRAFARHLPPSKSRYLLDIPDLQHPDNSADDLARIENALAVVAAS